MIGINLDSIRITSEFYQILCSKTVDQEIVFPYARLYFNVCMSITHSIIIIRTLWFHCHKHSQLQ